MQAISRNVISAPKSCDLDDNITSDQDSIEAPPYSPLSNASNVSTEICPNPSEESRSSIEYSDNEECERRVLETSFEVNKIILSV